MSNSLFLFKRQSSHKLFENSYFFKCRIQFLSIVSYEIYLISSNSFFGNLDLQIPQMIGTHSFEKYKSSFAGQFMHWH